MISIITSLYHSEAYLSSFLVQAQEMYCELKKENILMEHIYIANDPRQDELFLLNAHDCGVECVSRESLYASWNRGIKKSKGEFVTFWNVDDVRFHDAIEKGISVLHEGYDAVYFPFLYKRYIRVRNQRLLIKKKTVMPIVFDSDRFTYEMHAGPHFIVRKDVFEKIGLFDESYRIAGDFEWWTRFAKHGLQAKKVDLVSGVFTNDGHTLSGSKQTCQQEENTRIYGMNI